MCDFGTSFDGVSGRACGRRVAGWWWGPRSCNVVLRGSGVDDASENSKPV